MANLPRVIDHYDDGGILLRTTFADGVPPIVRTAINASASFQKHAQDYALVYLGDAGREYKLPVMDAGNAIASAIYFAEHGRGLPPEMQKVAAANLKTALEGYGYDVPDRLTKTAAMELGYSNESQDMSLATLFGVTADDPMREMKDAFDSCSPRGKRQMMLQVKEAGVALPEGLADYAGTQLGTDLHMAVELRKLAVMDKTASAQLEALLEKSASTDPETLASEIGLFDIEQGITHMYGKIFPDPYASVFGTTMREKVAAASIEVDGRTYEVSTVEDFARKSGSQISETFGEGFAAEFAKDPVAVMASLPVDNKRAIARMIG